NTKKADTLIPDNVKVIGRFNRRLMVDGKQIATLHFDNGFYSLNLEGGKILKDIGVKWVKIGFDLKTNTLFSPGVEDAHDDIIPKDEVVVLKDDYVVGVGKAVLSGDEMKRAVKGVAVKIRHRKKDK
ncbi:MAG: PUA domain-containing protein, partial [Methanobacterium sp.]